MNFIDLLMRGGTYGHYWYKQSTRSVWWNRHDRPEEIDTTEDAYFGVHPSSVKKSPSKRTLEKDIEAINCFYGDFDAKDFADDKEAVLEHIQGVVPQPTVIVDSGGGYHAYWIFDKPFELTTTFKQDIAKELQKRWVVLVGAAPEVHDLAHLLRLPGTFNYKYDPPKHVEVYSVNIDQTYSFKSLQELLPDVDDHRGVTVPAPKQPNELPLQELVDLAVEAENGDKFKRLFNGGDYGYASKSEADLAFCQLLAFWTGGDYHKMDALFRASQRMRVKWKREDYRHNTLVKAIMQTEHFYTDPNGLLTAGAHDEGNASCTYGRVKSVVSYCEALGWLHYDDGYWKTELAEPTVEDHIVDTLKARRSAAVQAEDEAIVRAAKPTAPNVMKAKTLLRRKVAVPISDFDTSLDELNVQNGVLNLRTGLLAPHSAKRKFTYCIPTRFKPDADPGPWLRWLLEATGDRQDVVDYLQVALGYSLTGRNREEVMFYIYGPARGGKGVFTETIIKMLGGRPLATEVDIDMFMSKTYNSGSVGFSLATLKAARFVAASESRENEWLNAKYIKRWTGQNLITCAHKYGRDFTYQPQFKIWLTSNFPPQMDADDEAAWGRLRIIRFPNSYLGKEDKGLKARMLKDDVLEGLLKWMIDGAVKWYQLGREGLEAPDVVQEATKEAQEDVDWVAAWIEEQITVTRSEDDYEPSDLYYSEYKDWCRDNGVSEKSLRSLNRSLRKKGFEVGTVKRIGNKVKRCWVGVKIGGFRKSVDRLVKENGKEI